MRSTELKVKIKHLAAEAKIIRAEETKAYNSGDFITGNNLHNHRTGKLRREARATLIAYQTLRGIPYEVYEGNAKTPPDWKAVERMLKKYGPEDTQYVLPYQREQAA